MSQIIEDACEAEEIFGVAELESFASFRMRFNEAFDKWLASCQSIIDQHYAGNYPNMTVPKLEVQPGRKYIKVTKSDGGVYAFIDGNNGDILKPASWKAPAKHPRGNIFDSSGGMACMSNYGPAYLR